MSCNFKFFYYNSQINKYNCNSTHSYNRKIWVSIPSVRFFLHFKNSSGTEPKNPFLEKLQSFAKEILLLLKFSDWLFYRPIGFSLNDCFWGFEFFSLKFSMINFNLLKQFSAHLLFAKNSYFFLNCKLNWKQLLLFKFVSLEQVLFHISCLNY